MGKPKQLCQDLKKMWTFTCPVPLGAIPKQLKVPQASVQTTVCKFKNLGTTQTLQCSERRRKLTPKHEQNSERFNWTTKELMNELEYQVPKIYIYSQKNSTFVMAWKAVRIMYGGIRMRLPMWRTPSPLWSMEEAASCCRGVLLKLTGALQKVGGIRKIGLSRNAKTKPQDISKTKLGYPASQHNDPKYLSKAERLEVGIKKQKSHRKWLN